MLAVALLINSLILTGLCGETRSIWEYQLGPIVANPYELSSPRGDNTAQQNGFSLADPIPGEGTNWVHCYPGDPHCKSASQINHEPQKSRLSEDSCWDNFAFTYYQTFITVPGASVSQFSVEYPSSSLDDAARVTIFNYLYPEGHTVAYSFLLGSGTVDLASFIVSGINRLVITQEDSCCSVSSIFATIKCNGKVLEPTCIPPSQQPCASSTWDPKTCDCVLAPISGPACDDCNPCTYGDRCHDGKCQGTPVICEAPQCSVGTCDPHTGQCCIAEAEDGSYCTDGDLCTQNDACVNGKCIGSPITCGQLDQCHIHGICVNGSCNNPNAPDGTPCDDGNCCTTNDTCICGVCVGGPPKKCIPIDQCHLEGTCDPYTGHCDSPPKCDGKVCDDGNACTLLDTCKNGVCVGTNPITCPPPGTCKEHGVCNRHSAVCEYENVCDGTPCDDGNACTDCDVCLSGICKGNPIIKYCPALDQCHIPGVCDNATGVCTNPIKPDGTSCNDGNPCTQTDSCYEGVCVGRNPVICTALDQCHIPGVCDTTTGNCTNPAITDGTPCDDDNSCTSSEVCIAGNCAEGLPTICEALDQCHDAGSCDPTSASGVCSNPNKPDGTPCDDGNACTVNDTCYGGKCVSGAPVICAEPDQCHVRGVCDTTTGTCNNPKKPDGAYCTDGNYCTQNDTCISGVCVGDKPVICTDLDQCHDCGTCDPKTGVCSNPKKPEGTRCNDGDFCTQTDTCCNGVCVGSNPKICIALDQCHDCGKCDPETGECSNPNKEDGTSCTDGNSCTLTDTCYNGACIGSNPKICDALDQCHESGECNPYTGECSNPKKPDGSECDNCNLCGTMDTCQNGICVDGVIKSCPPLSQCHDSGVCNPETGVCSNPEKPDGTGCNDGDNCTLYDTCCSGVCVGGNPKICTALDQCHDCGHCNPYTGECSQPNKPDGTPCDDGNACTLVDVCVDGCCVGHHPVVCKEKDQCYECGVCDPHTGVCSNPKKPDGSECDNCNLCGTMDTCQNGVCVDGVIKACPPLDQCHRPGVCDPETGVCSNPKQPEGTRCDDGNPCTLHDTCCSGVCVGNDIKICKAKDQCHECGECDPKTGECSNPNSQDGTKCDDGNWCTQIDVCIDGCCVGQSPKVCTALDQCHDCGECNPATGECSQPYKDDGTSCDNGNPCGTMDTCQDGVCVDGVLRLCKALDQCHDAGECNPETGLCSNPEKPDGTQCDDGNACTLLDVCIDGCCVGKHPKSCTELDQCHACGVCDPATGECSNPNKPNDTLCDDGNRCTRHDICIDGCCVGQNPKVCEAKDQCHECGECNPKTGECSNPNSPDNTHCDDGDCCTQKDICIDGCCVGKEPKICTPLDQCHNSGACNPETGECSQPYAHDGTPCDDGNCCTQKDVCIDGRCVGQNPKVCTALDQCHDCGYCNPATGECSHPEKPEGTPCDDGDCCTLTDTCCNGVCIGKNPKVCEAKDQCHACGECDPSTGECSHPDKPDGSPCDDGDCCTQRDVCVDGCCVGTDPVVCEATDQCYNGGSCSPETGVCTNPFKPDGSVCNDGNACTTNDTCKSGVCVGGAPKECTALDQCHKPGVCNPTTGGCTNPNKPDGTPCDDGNACTTTDTCKSGVCVGSKPVVCDACDDCHLPGTCDPTTGNCSAPAKPDGSPCNDHDSCTKSDCCHSGQCKGEQVCCKTSSGKCGTCVKDCKGSYHPVLDLFKQWHDGCGPDDVDQGDGGCPPGLYCCAPKDQRTCSKDKDDNCKIPDDH